MTAKRIKFKVKLALIALVIISCNQPGDNRITEDPFPKGDKINSENFTGTVYVNMLAPNDTIHNISMGNVTFEPGARSNWHYHPGGQVLIITHGKGHYQEEGKQVQIIKAGEVIKCPPNVKHWHGASPGESMTHTAISTNIDQGGVVWLSAVSNEEYNP
ncbi:(R)-mandelonitrile lyase [Salinimicrobium sp. WS361]|uniref:(R)-mandelonitrile lyase n=1 Tax=Salinimicrobium sp. WS361 TaxID=3425123 RepID=UPI003D6FAE8D